MAKKEGNRTIAVNRQARHEYFVKEAMEAGIELAGTEVKSIRQGAVNLKDSWCAIENGELFVRGMHISPYEKGNIFNKDPLRVKKLLMHRYESGNGFLRSRDFQEPVQGHGLELCKIHLRTIP